MGKTQDRFITLEEAGRLQNVSRFTVRRRMLAGNFPVFRDGQDHRRLVVRLSDLEKAFAPQPVSKEAA